MTWRMLGLAMPLTILALMALAMGLMGLEAASALLLASSLAPTDPVLASDVHRLARLRRSMRTKRVSL